MTQSNTFIQQRRIHGAWCPIHKPLTIELGTHGCLLVQRQRTRMAAA
jgi:hypothetical protein